MDLTTINIASRESIQLKCPQCGNAKQIVISQLPNIGRAYKVKCACSHKFAIEFDRRKCKRKRVHFIGSYSLNNTFTNDIIDIIEISRGGLSFVRRDKNDIKIGDTIIVRFNLDNAGGGLVECATLVRNIFKDRVCVEFVEMKDGGQRALEFYLF